MNNQFKIIKKAIIAVGLLLFFTKPSIALELPEYKYLKTTDAMSLKTYIYGVGEGYSWSNVVARQKGNQEFYCPPEKISINADNYMSILDREIANMEKSGKITSPVELILYFGLVDSFPCQN